jgi:hypothetical protein
LGDPLEVAETSGNSAAPASIPAPATRQIAVPVVPAALRQREALPQREQKEGALGPPSEQPTSSGTVVLDIEQGGIEVPSFAGKSVRAAIELAQESGLDLDVVGSGLAQEQSPSAGTRVPSGAKVIVKFER